MCQGFKCVAACSQCGKGATCSGVANHRAVCECPKGYIGSPHTECRPECYGDVDCPSNRPACFYGICKNTCEGACGIGADCHLRGLTPVCSCPRDMTGDPFIRCRPFTAREFKFLPPKSNDRYLWKYFNILSVLQRTCVNQTLVEQTPNVSQDTIIPARNDQYAHAFQATPETH